LEIAGASTEEILLVRFPTGRWSGITKADLRAMASQHPRGTQLREVLTTVRLPILHPDQRLDDALRFIQGHALLPVVSRAASRKLEGVLSLPDILTAYQRAS
jgi:CBS domain-containing protein